MRHERALVEGLAAEVLVSLLALHALGVATPPWAQATLARAEVAGQGAGFDAMLHVDRRLKEYLRSLA